MAKVNGTKVGEANSNATNPSTQMAIEMPIHMQAMGMYSGDK